MGSTTDRRIDSKITNNGTKSNLSSYLSRRGTNSLSKLVYWLY